MAMHRTRVWQITEVSTPEELAEKLTEHTWCCCNGFRLGGYYYLNDSTGPDGAQEYAIVKIIDLRQVESITFSWMNKEKALQYITDINQGRYNEEYGSINARQIESPAEHGTCFHCA